MGEPFMSWLRERTELALSHPRDAGQRWGGLAWNGLSNEELDCAEDVWGAPFPDDYRSFLRHLHCLGPDDGFPDLRRGSGWVRGLQDERREWLVDACAQEDLWLPGWGPRPDTLADRLEYIRERISAAPRLLPLYGHRFLIAELSELVNRRIIDDGICHEPVEIIVERHPEGWRERLDAISMWGELVLANYGCPE